MSHDKYLLVGHAVAFADVGEVLAQGRKVIMLDFDENTWEEIGVRITPEVYDKMVCDWDKYKDREAFADAILFKNRETISLDKGKYDFWFVDKVV